ncbi:MAG: hypothetical protein EBT18_09195 [Gammaproteobacteria bacterium]|nr:hypothetical protein [Gammaproteobacteria bacterium]
MPIILWLAAVLLLRPFFQFLEHIAIAVSDIPLLHGLIVIGILGVLIWIPVLTYKMIQDLEEPTQGIGMILFIVFFALPAWIISLFILKVFWGFGVLLVIGAVISAVFLAPIMIRVEKRGRRMRRMLGKRLRTLRLRR